MKTQQISLFNNMNQTLQRLTATDNGSITHKKNNKKTIKRPAVERTANDNNSQDTIYQTLVSELKKYFDDNRFNRAVLGVSGGVDSSLTLKIAADALGGQNVTALSMPELGVTKEENNIHAKTLCEFLGVVYFYQPINGLLLDFKMLPWKSGRLAIMNTKARLRAVLLYNYANTENALVLGTSNKTELLLGYGTKYGDLAADIEVIGDLYKTEVIKLADHIGLPPEIVNKIPTAELDLGQTDEAELGASYPELDKILMRRELGVQGCIEHGLPMALTEAVFKRMEQNKHKTESPFVIKVKQATGNRQQYDQYL